MYMDVLELNDEDLDSVLSNDPRDKLIEAIKTLRKQIDELKGIQRSPTGELLVQDDEIVEDEEEVLS